MVKPWAVNSEAGFVLNLFLILAIMSLDVLIKLFL